MNLHPARILALDPATRRTGVAYVSGGTDTICCPAKLTGDDRLDWWAQAFIKFREGGTKNVKLMWTRLEGAF